MERVKTLRPKLLVLIFVAVLGFFVYRLYVMQVYETGGLPADNVTYYVSQTRVKAARGDILDKNGNVLVGNRASYDLVINHYVLRNSATPNQSIYDLVMLCKNMGIEYTDRFPVTQERPFSYTVDQYNSAWQGYFQKFLQHRGELDSDTSATLLIETLRDSYEIPKEWTDEEARLVIGIRYEMTLRDLTTLSNYVFITDADEEHLSSILELNTPGLNVESSTVREYHTDCAAHILGYVGAMDKTQWEEYKKIDGYSIDSEVGQAGFEKAFEQYLHGSDGMRLDKVAPNGTIIESYYKEGQEPKAGNNVEVTIDLHLQTVAEEALANTMEGLRNQEEGRSGTDCEGAAVVVMDVRTGQVLVCASYPTYDLSRFFEDYNQILEADYNPLYNRALQATYPPGSTYKMSMVVAGINNHYINMASEIEDKGVFDKYKDTEFEATCLEWSRNNVTHGFINAEQALCVSCNYFFYEIGDKMTIEMIDETAKGFGLGEPTGIELSENIGYRANPESKAMVHKNNKDQARWYAADKVLASIGQSENRFSPLQLCVYTATLANRGTRLAATFLNRIVSNDYRELIAENKPRVMSQMEISDDAYMAYTNGMRMVASYNDGKLTGTAYWKFVGYPIEIAAKTGTAQTDKKGASDHGAFVCYAPFRSPEIAIAVYGERAGSGATMSAVARAILDMYFEVGTIGDIPLYENQLS